MCFEARAGSFNVPVTVHHERLDELAEIPDLQKNFIRKLSIFVTGLDGSVKPLLQGTRSGSGILVVGQAAWPNAVDTGLEAGDIICAIDRTPLQSISQFQEMVHNLKPGDPVVFQVERKGKLQYLAFEME
jgi:S1-C subfamily serine protease